MSIYLHNISEEARSYNGVEIAADEFWLIPTELEKEFSTTSSLSEDIFNGVMAVSQDGEVDISDVDIAILYLMKEYHLTLAIDMDNSDYEITDQNWHVVPGTRVIWDVSSDYDIINNNLNVPVNCVCTFDIQLRMKSMFNVGSVELAIFKREEPEDDYWFIIDKKDPETNSEVQMSGATSFDFYNGDKYALKIKLTKSSGLLGISGTIDGNDDYTAWGYNMVRFLV